MRRAKGLKKDLKRVIDRYVLPDSVLIRKQYLHRHGYRPDLRNPLDLSEKLLWLKLHDRSPLHTLCADKIRARDYVAAKVGPEILLPALLISYDPANVCPEKIRAERFVVKTNHDQGGVFICADRDSFDWENARAKIARRLQINKYYEFREHQYKNIRPGILVETFVSGPSGGNVQEIKFYCFHGVPRFVQVVHDRFESRREIFYDVDWKRMPFRGPAALIEHEIDPPACYDRLLRQAAILSEPFMFARIDFLLGEGGAPWFGEITFYHGAGLIRFEPPEFERAFGDMIDLSRLGEMRRRREDPAEDRAALARPVGHAAPGRS